MDKKNEKSKKTTVKAQNKYVLSSSVKNKEIQVHSYTNGTFISSVPGHKDGIWKMHLHKKGSFFSGGRDKRIIEWKYSFSDKKKLQISGVSEYLGHSDWIRDITSLSDSTIASISDDTYLKIWDVKTHWCQTTLRAVNKAPLTIMRPIGTKDSKVHIVTGSDNGWIHHFDLKAEKEKISWKAHEKSVSCLEYSTLSRHLLYSCEQYSDVIKIWDSRLPLKSNPKPVGVLFSHTNEIWDFLLKGDKLYTAAQDGSIKEWNVHFKNTRTWKDSHEGHCVYALYDSGEGTLLSGGDDKCIKKWDLKSGKLVLTFKSNEKVHDLIAI